MCVCVTCTLRDGNGYLDISELYRMFKSVFQGIGSYEARVLVAYVFMMDVERDGFVRPDELLQALRVIPMKSPTGKEDKRPIHTYTHTHACIHTRKRRCMLSS